MTLFETYFGTADPNTRVQVIPLIQHELSKSLLPDINRLIEEARTGRTTTTTEKRPPNAYNLFVKAFRVEHPDEPQNFSHVASVWRGLPPEKKQKYYSQAEVIQEKTRAAHPVKDKRPPTGYNLFMSEYHRRRKEAKERGELVEEEGEESLFERASTAWKSLSPLEQKYYTDKSAKMRPPKKRRQNNINGYNLFVKEQMPIERAAHPELKNTELIKLVSSKWATVDKSIWNNRAQAMREQAETESVTGSVTGDGVGETVLPAIVAPPVMVPPMAVPPMAVPPVAAPPMAAPPTSLVAPNAVVAPTIPGFTAPM